MLPSRSQATSVGRPNRYGGCITGGAGTPGGRARRAATALGPRPVVDEEMSLGVSRHANAFAKVQARRELQETRHRLVGDVGRRLEGPGPLGPPKTLRVERG